MFKFSGDLQIISAVITATEIVKLVILSFVLYSKVFIFSRDLGEGLPLTSHIFP